MSRRAGPHEVGATGELPQAADSTVYRVLFDLTEAGIRPPVECSMTSTHLASDSRSMTMATPVALQGPWVIKMPKNKCSAPR